MSNMNDQTSPQQDQQEENLYQDIGNLTPPHIEDMVIEADPTQGVDSDGGSKEEDHDLDPNE